jgi:hypothetical protein
MLACIATYNGSIAACLDVDTVVKAAVVIPIAPASAQPSSTSPLSEINKHKLVCKPRAGIACEDNTRERGLFGCVSLLIEKAAEGH